MSIRLNKALSELNIGLQTAVDFLEKKKELGDVPTSPTNKITEEQYTALVEHFRPDREAHSLAERIIKKPKDKKPAPSAPATQPQGQAARSQQFKPLGKVNLDDLAKGRAVQPIVETVKPVEPADKPIEPADKAEPTPQPDAITAEKEPQEATVQAEQPKQEATTVQPAKQETAPIAAEPTPEVAEQPSDNGQKAQSPKPAETVKKAEQPAAAEQKGETEKPNGGAEKPNGGAEKPNGISEKAEQQAQQGVTPTSSKPDDSANKPNADAVKPNGDADKAESKEDKATETTATDQNADADKPAQTLSPSGRQVFTTKSERKMLSAQGVNVVGKIDLATINQNTRPKKKSKSERRREREERAKQGQTGQQAQGGEKKKRERINKAKVDINAAARQAAAHPEAAKGQKNAQKKKKKGQQRPLDVNEEDVARQVKETLARLTNKQNQNKKGAKYRREKRDAIHERINEERAEQSAGSKVLKLTEFVTVSELATMMNISVTKLIGTLMSVGIMVSINQRLDAETINLVADEFGFTTEYVSAEVQNAITEEEDDENDLVSRAPIVTVMGHVDHGKTSLLDYIRKTNVIAGEAGGITQHIGAYNVKLEDGRRITFLDTPGHEAFTAMRARGAQVTDIAIIIIAADDSVMPTTKEAIAHAQAANVPMVFAINKIDKPGANPDKIREDLAQMNLLVEEWGGKYQCQEISAKKGMGVADLLEKVLLEAEMLDLKANPNRKATGSVIESSLDKGRGYVSTVLVSNGTLRVGDVVIAGTSYGRIKAMFNERNQRINEVKPAEPAIILGLNGAPTAGDSFHIMETEQEAREIANKRLQLQREQGLRTNKTLGLEEIARRIAKGEFHELNLVVKGDTDGSVEALSDSFIKMSTDKIQVNVILKGVGQISENDVMMASAAKNAMIVGFQVRPSAAARKVAEQEGVEINTYSVIYDAIDDIHDAMEGMLDKVKKEVATAQVEVREVYHISKVGTVAGAFVSEGKVHRQDKVRVVRDGIVIHTAPINALKRFKDDVKEVAANFECGISLVGFNDIMVGDVLETFTEIEVQQKL